MIRDLINQKRDELQNIKYSATTQTNSFADLEKLAELRDKGIVTAEEFEVKKRQILGL
jgi:hypothetical protein